MANLERLESALRAADAAGDMDSARKLAAVIRRERNRRESDPQGQLLDQIGGDPVDAQVTIREPEQTLTPVEQVQGIGETGLTLASGMTGGLAGTAVGAIEGIIKEVAAGNFGTDEAARRIEELATQRAGQLTYAPRTQSGQQKTEVVGEALAPLAAIPPMAEIAAITGAAGAGARQVGGSIARNIRDRATRPPVDDLSAGAAQNPAARVRQDMANELPVPIKLTEGQKTRDFEIQRFERETAKMPEGAPIRDRFEDQNLQLQQNLDEFIDATGAQVTDLRGVGEVVDRALRGRVAKDKVRIRSLFQEADRAGETRSKVSLNNVASHLTESGPEATTAPLIKVMRDKGIQLGVFKEAPDGSLIAQPVTIKTAEQFRRTVNRNAGIESPNIRQASIIKRLVDDTTEAAGGDIYKRARAARRKFAQDYENVSLVKNLIGTKRGTDDRAVALEDVLRKSILDPSASLDSMRQVRRLLQTKSGPEGKQAWKELQGATIRHIQDQMTKGVTTNQRGDRVVSASQLDRAISKLDQSGKLDYLFGKKGAEQLRTINDVAKLVLTAPPGSVNYSNTATVLAGLMDVAITGFTGIPAPIASGFKLITDRIKDRKLKERIKKTLGD